MDDAEKTIEKVFAPALNAQAIAAAPAKVEAGVPNQSIPTVAEAGEAEEKARTASMDAFASRVMDHMRINYEARVTSDVEDRLVYCITSQTCTFNDEQRRWLESIGINKRVYSPLTATKVRSVYSMLMELSQYGDEVPFSIAATPDPETPDEVEREVFLSAKSQIEALMGAMAASGVTEVPPDIEQQLRAIVAKVTNEMYDRALSAKDSFARNRARRMQRKVWDLMVQGGYKHAYMKCLDDFCTYGTCVMVGPVMRNVAHNKSVMNKKSGVRKIKRVIDSIQCYERVNPVDCYPAPDAEEVTDGALCVRVRYTKEELWRFKKSSADGDCRRGEDGWRDSAVAKLLADHPDGVRLDQYPRNRVFERAEDKDADQTRICKYEGVRCFCYAEGRELLSCGITKSMDGVKIDLDGFYYTETIVIDGLVVFCRIYDERMGSPLSKSVFYSKPGSWWGESLADKLYSVQTVMNNAIIALLRNMGPASSAMMWIKDVSRLVDKSDDGLSAEPGKIYAFGRPYTDQRDVDSGVPMGVLQIPSNASELLAVANWATKQADIDSGIPAFSEGTGGSNGGALRTAEGLRTYTEHATRGVKAIAVHLEGITSGPAKQTADWILIYDDDMDLKGDVEVMAVGPMNKLLKAQHDQARLQLFNVCLNSQFLTSIIGVKGMVELFRPSLKDVDVNPDNVCPSPERIEMLEQFEQLKQILAAAGGARQNPDSGQQPAKGTNQGVAPVAAPSPTGGGGVAGRRGAG